MTVPRSRESHGFLDREREPTERVNIVIVVKREKERHDKRMTEEKRREIERIREKDVRRERERDSVCRQNARVT